MADEAKVEVKVTEAPEKSVREKINDSLTESTEESSVETDEKSTDLEISDEAKEMIVDDAAEKDALKDSEVEDNESELDAILKESESVEVTPNVQKRIDKLTAEKKALQEEVNKLKSTKEPTTKDAPKYSDEQLKIALRKAMDDGDSDLVWDIMNYKTKQVKDELIKAYEDEKSNMSSQQRAIVEEWNQVVNAYSKYADTKIPEIYPGSHKDLDVNSGTSLLYQVAMALYSSEDPEKAKYYKQPGGQRLAVSDALTIILSKKGVRTKDGEKQLLKKQLLKEKRKKNVVGSGNSGEEERPARNLSDEDVLADVINERKKFHSERGK